MSTFTNTPEKDSDTSLKKLPVDAIASKVRTVFERNKRAKVLIEQEMLECQRQRNGEYEPRKLAQLRETEMSTVWVMLTNAKCRAAEAFILDILQNSDEKPWGIKPTPVPELDPDVLGLINQQVNLETTNAAQAFQQISGQVVPPSEIAAAADKRSAEVEATFRMNIEKAAKDAADAMEDEIDDQLKEGKWYVSFRKIVSDLVTFPTAILKGPLIRQKKTLTWNKVLDGSVTPSVTEQPAPEFDRVSPFDIYPEAGTDSLQDGDVIEKLSLSRRSLNNLKGLKGFSKKAIDTVLFRHGDRGFREATSIDTERIIAENKDPLTIPDSTKIECLEFWGTMSGKSLNEWNISVGLNGEKLENEMDYEAHIITCDDVTLKAGLNSDPLGKRPYYTASYEAVTGSFWGHGIPYIIRDMQETVNSTTRAMINNLAIASGPQVEYDVDKIPQEFRQNLRITPWGMWPSQGNDLNANPAVRFYQPKVVINELMILFNKASQLADEHLGIPSFQHGGTNVGPAGETASGLSMLMTSAARGIKNVIQHLDVGVIAPLIEAMYNFNMEFNIKESIKGDVKVVARGTSSLVAKELLQRRRTEFLNFTNNPVDLQLMGPEGRKKLLSELFRSLELDIDSDIFKENAQGVAPQGQSTQAPSTQSQSPQKALTPATPDGQIAGGENIFNIPGGK